MGVIKYRAPNPVIHQAPGPALLISNFNRYDYAIWAGITVTAFPIGYSIGGKARNHLMWTTAVLGFVAGFTGNLIRSGGRLMGYTDNQEEAAFYKWRKDFSKYQVRVEPFRTIIEEELHEITDNPRY